MSLQTIDAKPKNIKRKAIKKQKTITVRMYDVGFGDCFLIFIPQAEGNITKILIDCGSIKLGMHSESMHKVVEQVINDVKKSQSGTPRIDLVIATHRHKDHIIGFDDPAWAEVEVGEVWMPWTEKNDDPQALRIRELHKQLADKLIDRLGDEKVNHPTKLAVSSAFEMVFNALSNDHAMNTLYQGFANPAFRRFLPDENTSQTKFSPSILPGVTVTVLGPSRNPDVISELDPPSGQSS